MLIVCQPRASRDHIERDDSDHPPNAEYRHDHFPLCRMKITLTGRLMQNALLRHSGPAFTVWSDRAVAIAPASRSMMNVGRVGGWIILGVAMAVLTFLVVQRTRVITLWPQTEALYRTFGVSTNLRGVTFHNLASAIVDDHGRRVLQVQGTVANVSREAQAVPALRFEVRDEAGQTIYQWNVQTGIPELRPGAEAPFRARLVAPPVEASTVVVRFIDRGERS